MDKKLIVIGVVFNDKNEVLLTQRYDPKFPDAHLKWDLPGGSHESGETLERTVEREVLEETGYKARVEKMIPYHLERFWKSAEGSQEVVVLGFRCKLLGGKPHLNDHKIQNIKWAKQTDIRRHSLLLGVEEFIKEAIMLT